MQHMAQEEKGKGKKWKKKLKKEERNTVFIKCS